MNWSRWSSGCVPIAWAGSLSSAEQPCLYLGHCLRIIVGRGEQVAVDVERDLDRGVAHYRLDFFGCPSLLDEEGSGRMAKCVEAIGWSARRLAFQAGEKALCV
jgi:hypothetical protein